MFLTKMKSATLLVTLIVGLAGLGLLTRQALAGRSSPPAKLAAPRIPASTTVIDPEKVKLAETDHIKDESIILAGRGALENAGSKAKVVNKPKVELGLKSIVRGKPEGPPPMPSARLSLEPTIRSARPGALTALAASPWAPLIAVSGQKQVLLYHSETFDLLGVLPFPEGIPQVLKFSRNGSLLLAGGGRGGKSGRVVVWSIANGERLFEIGEETDCVLAADISADQTQIALGGPGKVIRVFSCGRAARHLAVVHYFCWQRKHTCTTGNRRRGAYSFGSLSSGVSGMTLPKRNKRDYLEIEDSTDGFSIMVKQEGADELAALLTQHGIVYERRKSTSRWQFKTLEWLPFSPTVEEDAPGESSCDIWPRP